MEDSISKMKSLIKRLNEASDAYYLDDNPIMSDKEYDDLSDELAALEKKTGVIMSNSTLHKVQGKLLDGLQKVIHVKPMLSADKTKDMNVVGEFISKNPTVQSWKLDGLTIVCRWEKGEYKQAITRGSGDIGEDVTEAFRHCINLPLTLSKPVDLMTRGECVISWSNFEKINEKLEEPYSHPRNLAAGSVRNLDTNIAKERYLEYKVFELVSIDGNESMDVLASFKELQELGLDVVEHKLVTEQNYLDIDKEKFNPETYDFPVDGTIYKYDSYEYGSKLGSTSHHPLNMLARKWEDELFETILRDIEWNTTRTGLINPVAIFDEVLLDNAATTRATLHNVSYIEDLELGIGDTIRIYRANAVIPKVHDNLTKSNTYKLIDKCPCCGGAVEIRCENKSKTLHCINPDCQAKLVSKLVHAVGKHALNIEGLSESTLEFLVEKGWVNSLQDLFNLHHYRLAWKNSPGFGEKSVSNLLEQITLKSETTFERFLYAQSIPLIGRTASKDISKFCNGDVEEFCKIMSTGAAKKFMTIDGFGETMYESLMNWYENHWIEFLELKQEFEFLTETKQNKNDGVDLCSATFCITGKLVHFANRDALVSDIESHNGKYVSSVTSKTNYLINNDKNSTSSKNTKAKQVGCTIISEQDYLNMIGVN